MVSVVSMVSVVFVVSSVVELLLSSLSLHAVNETASRTQKVTVNERIRRTIACLTAIFLQAVYSNVFRSCFSCKSDAYRTLINECAENMGLM